MASYPQLRGLIPGPQAVQDWKRAVDYLVDIWLRDYAAGPNANIVETRSNGFSYLFDIDAGRLIAAWGLSQGKHTGARDKSRMSGHPLGAGPRYHRGHAIPHTLGGPTDINLVPQLGSINVGPFRRLEKLAVATPGSFYFTYWTYRRGPSQQPSGVDQGLLIPGHAPDIQAHGN